MALFDDERDDEPTVEARPEVEDHPDRPGSETSTGIAIANELVKSYGFKLGGDGMFFVNSELRPGDIVVCLGAGTITQWAYALPGQLAALDGKA